jgi:type I restriction enzyme S subunit
MNRAYPSYKSINQKWAKQIPSHWAAKRLKAVFAMRKERNNPIVTENILSLTAKQGVVPYAEKEGTGGNKPKNNLTQYNVAHKNDLLVNCMNVVSGAAGVSKFHGAISPVYYALYPRHDENVWYYHHIFRLLPFQRSLIGLGKGILMHESENGTLTSVRMRISMDYLGNVLLPVPPRNEQDQIVRFLDWKVSDINKLISNYCSQISILGELKQRLINEAVTKGLRKEHLIHSENNRWDIDYPENWVLQRMKESFSFRNGLSITKANLEETGVAVISYGQVHSKNNSGVGLNDELIRYVSESYLTTNQSCLVEKGDFIFADTSEDVAGCGNCVYVDRDDDIFAGYHSIIAHPDSSTNSKYLAYLFKSATWRYQIRKNVNGVKVYTITQKILKDTFVLIPPIDEQEEIVHYLDNICRKIDSTIKKMEEKTVNLQELKVRLVADTVTGKIDIRDVEIPEYEFTDEDVEIEGVEAVEGENEPPEEE